jgi:hypothetical protein
MTAGSVLRADDCVERSIPAANERRKKLMAYGIAWSSTAKRRRTSGGVVQTGESRMRHAADSNRMPPRVLTLSETLHVDDLLVTRWVGTPLRLEVRFSRARNPVCGYHIARWQGG